MKEEMKFNSQICTTREQSERLLALGLKKETADMCWTEVGTKSRTYYVPELAPINMVSWRHTPAWSLHRLIDMMPQIIGHSELAVNDAFVGYYEDRCGSETGMYWEHTEESSNLYDNIISTIEWLIKEGYFPKEYLV